MRGLGVSCTAEVHAMGHVQELNANQAMRRILKQDAGRVEGEICHLPVPRNKMAVESGMTYMLTTGMPTRGIHASPVSKLSMKPTCGRDYHWSSSECTHLSSVYRIKSLKQMSSEVVHSGRRMPIRPATQLRVQITHGHHSLHTGQSHKKYRG